MGEYKSELIFVGQRLKVLKCWDRFQQQERIRESALCFALLMRSENGQEYSWWVGQV